MPAPTKTKTTSGWSITKLCRLIEPGANLYRIEWILPYALGFWVYALKGGAEAGSWSHNLHQLCGYNTMCQLLLFLPLVQLPTLITGHMSYVDIGWPAGLVVLAWNVYNYNSGDGSIEDSAPTTRTKVMATCLCLHGLRMLVGSLQMLYPYHWPTEFFARYQYAKARWIQHTGSEDGWWLKQQHDTIMQAMANSVCLAAPFLICATNPHTTSSHSNDELLHPVELLGAMVWATAWAFENWADLSKKWWEVEAKRNGDYLRRTIGHQPPYHQGYYYVWSLSRHPNYFGEFMCWISFTIMALPSACKLMEDQEQYYSNGTMTGCVIFAVLLYGLRVLYDCLVYWTGAAPAESRSVERRAAYKDYQATTNVFFPFDIPWFLHHRTPGWPLVVKDDDRLGSRDKKE